MTNTILLILAVSAVSLSYLLWRKNQYLQEQIDAINEVCIDFRRELEESVKKLQNL